jgi:hypothetical protein
MSDYTPKKKHMNILTGNPKGKISSGRLGLRYEHKDNILMDSLNNMVSEIHSSVS